VPQLSSDARLVKAFPFECSLPLCIRGDLFKVPANMFARPQVEQDADLRERQTQYLDFLDDEVREISQFIQSTQ